jgi:SulP family sulfate permease
VVAWNISEIEAFRHTLSAPKGDRLVLLLTFFLTVFFDLTLAIEVGVVVAAFVFMFRMANAVEVESGQSPEDDDTGEDLTQRARLPAGVEAFRINGPLFFGAANRLDDLLDQFRIPPKVFILRMRLVPVIDASGVHALENLLDRCQRRGIVLVVSGLQPQPRKVLAKMPLRPRHGMLHIAPNFDSALEMAKALIQGESTDDLAS